MGGSTSQHPNLLTFDIISAIFLDFCLKDQFFPTFKGAQKYHVSPCLGNFSIFTLDIVRFDMEKCLFILVFCCCYAQEAARILKTEDGATASNGSIFPAKNKNYFWWPATGSGRPLDLAGHWIIALFVGMVHKKFQMSSSISRLCFPRKTGLEWDSPRNCRKERDSTICQIWCLLVINFGILALFFDMHTPESLHVITAH